MNVRATLLVLLGVLAMGGHGLDVPALRGLAMATAASPAPKVFTTVSGLESFSSRFSISWNDSKGGRHSVDLDAARYARLRGPYNRRNVYGAMLAFGPLMIRDPLVRPMLQAVMRFSACNTRPLLRELGIPVESVRDPVLVHVQPRSPRLTPNLTLAVEVPCE